MRFSFVQSGGKLTIPAEQLSSRVIARTLHPSSPHTQAIPQDQTLAKPTLGLCFPQAKAPDKRVLVVAQASIRRQLFEVLGIASSKHHVFDFESVLEPFDDVGYMAAPILFSEPLQTAKTNIVLVSLPMFIRKMRQFHRLQDSIDDHRGAQPGAEAQKEHPSPLVTSEGLHGSIIGNLDRTTECLAEIKPNPAGAHIVWLAKGTSMDHGTGISDRNAVILPVPGDALHIPHHFI